MSKDSISERLAKLKASKSISSKVNVEAGGNQLTISGGESTKEVENTLTEGSSPVSTPTPPSPNSLAAKLAARKVSGTINITAAESSEATNPTPDPQLESLLIKPQGIDELEDLNADEFLTKLTYLNQAIEAKAPAISTYLQEINKSLVQFQELAHILNEDQIATIVSGLLFLTNTNMAEAVTKKGSRKVMKIDEVESIF